LQIVARTTLLNSFNSYLFQVDNSFFINLFFWLGV